MKYALAYFSLCLALFSLGAARGQSPAVGQDKKLIFHDIRTDARGHLLPWYDPEPGKSYDHVLRLVWKYWQNVPGYWIRNPSYKRVYPKWYMIFCTLDDPGIGGDQVAALKDKLPTTLEKAPGFILHQKIAYKATYSPAMTAAQNDTL